jgi:hypothetical protein
MSTNLVWAPPPAEVREYDLDLKWEIGRYFDEQYNGGTIDMTVDRSIVPFLKGIIAGSSDKDKKAGADSLIQGINKYGRVQLYTK